MKFLLYESQQALREYHESSYHERLNIMTRYFEEVLPVMVEELKKLEDETK